ncbi:MAG: MurT ligase domain-containing protein [Tissierellia bacterium]|nr:MurT ligase domain-containing protein [Tissierellia bacterium]
MKFIAIIIAKIVLFFGRLLGRGSSLPGMIARKISPGILNEFKYPDVVMVTGTNGKTSTTHFISSIMERASMKVAHNKEGANMPQGITTILIENSDLKGNIDADICVLEVDEGFLKTMTDQIIPEYIVLTNLFEDQIDRFSSIEELAEKIKMSIPRETKLIINANDPVLVQLGYDLIENEKVYFGVEEIKGTGEQKYPCQKCRCGQELFYTKILYDKLGYYSCDCGFKTPRIDYLATDVDLENKSFKLNGFEFKSKYGTDYFVFNLMAAISYAKEIGITDAVIEKGISEYEIGSGRLQPVKIGKHDTILNLVKNPSGLNRSIEYIDRNSKDDYLLFLAVNKRPADGEDGSWLNSVNFNALKDNKAKEIICTGEAVDEIVNALKNSGIPEEKIKITEDIPKTVSDLCNSDIKPYFLTNYTAMESVSKAIEQNKSA